MAKFYIGDLGYAFPLEHADAWIDMVDAFYGDPYEPFYEVDGRQFTMQDVEDAYSDETPPFYTDSATFGMMKYDDIPEGGRESVDEVIADEGAYTVEIDADSVEEVIAKGLVPPGIKVYDGEELTTLVDY